MIGSFNIILKFSIDGMCVVALALATNTMSGPTIHHHVMMLLMSS